MNRRVFLKSVASLGAVAALPIRWIQEPRTVVIAAFDSSELAKRRADVVCNWRNDGAMIQQALDMAGEGGAIVMDGGTFVLDRTIDLRHTRGSIITNCHFLPAEPAPNPMFVL